MSLSWDVALNPIVRRQMQYPAALFSTSSITACRLCHPSLSLSKCGKAKCRVTATFAELIAVGVGEDTLEPLNNAVPHRFLPGRSKEIP